MRSDSKKGLQARPCEAEDPEIKQRSWRGCAQGVGGKPSEQFHSIKTKQFQAAERLVPCIESCWGVHTDLGRDPGIRSGVRAHGWEVVDRGQKKRLTNDKGLCDSSSLRVLAKKRCT